MTEAKPLHVQVAEALGWTDIEPPNTPWSSPVIVNPRPGEGPWLGREPLSEAEGPRWERAQKTGGDILLPYQTGPDSTLRYIDRYDVSWDATGPLLEKYGISLSGPDEINQGGFESTTDWRANEYRDCQYPHYADPTTQEEAGAAEIRCACKSASAPTPLEAICRLILALAAAGKLKEK